MLEFSSHPDTDLALELLCTLPVEPDSVPLNDLLHDFGFSQQSQIISLIMNLRERDYKILIFHRHNGGVPSTVKVKCASISRRASLAALADCEHYWNRIHRDNSM